MVDHSELGVELVAVTQFRAPTTVPFDTDADGGQALVEFAGRACFESWDKPNPRTATNRGYLRHILETGHFSLLEHGSATFYLTGVSRSCTHELVRHRHFSFSQLSQRFVANEGAVVLPPAVAEDPELTELFLDAAAASQRAYTELLEKLERRFADQGAPGTGNALLRRKQARQAARAVLPNATETKIVVTGNFRAWRHFIGLRATVHADVEIRRLAIAVLRELRDAAPALFDDWEISAVPDGTEVASTPLAAD